MKNYIFVDTLGPLIERYHPRVIVETGTHRGRSGCYMVLEALKHHPDVEFHGFDLFDMATDNTHLDEINGKGTGDYAKTLSRFEAIKQRHPQFQFWLYRGFTTNTLVKPISADLAYIDGGHSTATVLHDFSMVRTSRVVVFDDYQMDSVREAIKMAGIEDHISTYANKKTAQAIYVNQ